MKITILIHIVVVVDYYQEKMQVKYKIEGCFNLSVWALSFVRPNIPFAPLKQIGRY